MLLDAIAIPDIGQPLHAEPQKGGRSQRASGVGHLDFPMGNVVPRPRSTGGWFGGAERVVVGALNH